MTTPDTAARIAEFVSSLENDQEAKAAIKALSQQFGLAGAMISPSDITGLLANDLGEHRDLAPALYAAISEHSELKESVIVATSDAAWDTAEFSASIWIEALKATDPIVVLRTDSGDVTMKGNPYLADAAEWASDAVHITLREILAEAERVEQSFEMEGPVDEAMDCRITAAFVKITSPDNDEVLVKLA